MTENALKLDFRGEKSKNKNKQQKKCSNLIKESRVSIIDGPRSLNDLFPYLKFTFLYTGFILKKGSLHDAFLQILGYSLSGSNPVER